MALCETCEEVLNALSRAPGEAYLGHTTQQLEIRAKQGCHLCTQFLGTFKDSRPRVHAYIKRNESLGQIIVAYWKQQPRSTSTTLSAGMRIHPPVPDDRPFNMNLAIIESTTPELPPEDAPLEDSTGSEQSLRLAKSWIEDCQANHAECGDWTERARFLPTRLIDLGSSPSDNIRLCLGKEVPPGTRYVTLSHCWGSIAMPERLLEDNLQSKFQSIEVLKLPRNFQGAIYLVRNLGSRYLWIDSLCIVQDSKEDWQREAALMGEVYLHGYCNLAAVAAKDSSVGMIYKREPAEVLPVRFKLDRADGEGGDDAFLCDQRLWYDGVYQAPLLRRGWVCQERLLSPKNLLFGKKQIFWECGMRTACETFPKGLPLQIESFIMNPSLKRKAMGLWRATANMAKPSLDEPNHPLHLWSEILCWYSSCQLAFGSDRLVAIGGGSQETPKFLLLDVSRVVWDTYVPRTNANLSAFIAGLAAMSHRRFSGDYVAGLWREYLPFELLWHTIGNASKLSPPTSYRAPSWSWAAVDSEIMEHPTTSNCVSLVEVVHTHIDLDGTNPHGQVKGGYVEMDCTLAPARLAKYDWLRLFPAQVTILATWDYSLSAEDKEVTFYLAPLCGGTPGLPKDSERHHTLTGLIVTKHKEKEGCFIRRGTFDTHEVDAKEVVNCCREFAKASDHFGILLSDDGSWKFHLKII